MGRRRKGPYQLKKGDTWYCRLVIPEKDRPIAGKTSLIRSLKTTDHSEALKRYGAAYAALEQELNVLLGATSLSTRVEQHREGLSRPGDDPLTPAELTAITFGSLEPDNPVHEAAYEAFETGQQLLTWKEALQIHIKATNRNRPRPFSDSSLYKYNQAIQFFSTYSLPTKTTPQTIRQWISDHEEEYDPVTVSQRFRYLRAIYKSCIAEGKINTHSPFDLVVYKATAPLERQRRSYTHDEIRLIHKGFPHIFSLLMTGLRAGEYFSREPTDLKNGILRVDENKKIKWRPKYYPSSVRNVAVPPEFILYDSPKTVGSCIRDVGLELRKHITQDPNAPLHSTRHTFLTLSRMAGCDTAVITAQTGHFSKDTSRVAQQYGDFPDKALLREAQKVWDYVNNNILTNDPSSTRVSSVH